MTAPVMHTPLEHRAPLAADGKVIEMAEAPLSGKLIVRIDPAIAPFDAPAACRFRAREGGDVLWLGPDEWMFLTALDALADTRRELEAACAGRHHQIVDVTDYYTTIRLRGPKSADALMKLTTLDLHPGVFAPGSVAGSNFAKAAAWLMRREDAWEIIVRWSMADYLWCMLAGAGREFGLPVQEPAHGGSGLRHRP